MMLQTLRRTPMLAGLPEDKLGSLLDGCRLLNLAKGEVLFHEDAQPEGFYVVHAGAINVHRLTADGREQVIRVFYPGESLAEVVLTGDRGYPASASAVEKSQVILVRRDHFRHEIRRDPDLALRILASFSMHLRFLVETVEDLKLKQAESRIAQWLLRHAERSSGEAPAVNLQLAKRLLASQLGLTPETFSRVLARWREVGVVAVRGRRITLLDVDVLGRHLEL